jgi:hypothetical protein
MRAAQLLAGVVAKLGLEYYQQHAGQVQAMALSMLPLRLPSQTRKSGRRIKWLNRFHQNFLPEYHSKLFYWLVLEDTTPPSVHPPDELVRMMYDLDSLPGAASATFRCGKTPSASAPIWRVFCAVLAQFLDGSCQRAVAPWLRDFAISANNPKANKNIGAGSGTARAFAGP